MQADVLSFFENFMADLPLYEKLERPIIHRIRDISIREQ